MKNLSSTIMKIFLLIALLTLLGCNAQATATPTIAAPTTVPTVDPQIFASTVSAARTEAVQTVYEQLTQAVTSTPLPTDTPQPTDTATMTPVPPTLTPTKIIVYAPTFTVVPTQGAYQCSISNLSPAYGDSLTSGADFDLAVTLDNIGTKEWSTDNIDFKYLSGAKFQKKVDGIDLPSNVDPGDSIHLVIDMTATTGTGVQNASWGLVFGSTPFCVVNIQVNVK